MRDMIDDAITDDRWSFQTKVNRTHNPKTRLFYRASKRVFDVVVCVLALPVFAMLCAIVWVINFFLNPGPLFFCQDRMGKDQLRYKMIKFRSMLPDDGSVARGAFDGLEDWRITRFGGWMRLTRLDEVPQILNVIMGQMSLIGPRPEVFEYAEIYHQEIAGYDVRVSVRPGITGYAQVKQGYADTEEAVRVKTTLDTFYVQNMNWWLDLKVLLWTVRTVCTSDGAR